MGYTIFFYILMFFGLWLSLGHWYVTVAYLLGKRENTPSMPPFFAGGCLALGFSLLFPEMRSYVWIAFFLDFASFPLLAYWLYLFLRVAFRRLVKK